MRDAFVLLEFVIAILILSLISIALSKAMITLKKHTLAKSNIASTQLALSNSADMVRNYLQAESSFTFLDSTLSFSNHKIILQGGALMLDGALIMENVLSFEVLKLSEKAFSVHVCSSLGGNKVCINRVGFCNL